MRKEKLIKYAAIILLLFFFSNIPIYIFDYVIGYSNFIKPVILQLLLTLIVAAHMINVALKNPSFNDSAGGDMIRPYFAWLIYSLLSFLLLFRFGYNFSYMIFAFKTITFYPLIFFPLLFNVSGKKDSSSAVGKIKIFDSLIFKTATIAIVPIVALGVAQYFLRDNFIDTAVAGAKDNIQGESSRLDTFRPNSIFFSALDFGHFCLFVFLLSAAYFFSRKDAISLSKKIMSFFAMLFSFLGVLVSQTRIVYLCLILGIATLLVFKRALIKKKAGLLLNAAPFLFLIVGGVSLFVTVIYMYFLNLGEGLTDVHSAVARFMIVLSIYNDYIEGSNLTDLLLGHGLIQHAGGQSDTFPEAANLIDGSLALDNMFLQYYVYQGLVGLVLFLYFYYSVWKRLVLTVLATETAFVTGLSAYFSTILVAGFYNTYNTNPMFYLSLFLSISAVALYSEHMAREAR